MTAPSLLKWHGSKAKLAGWIVNKLPPVIPNQHYCEPFCGMAWVLMRRPRAELETIVDCDRELLNFILSVQKDGEELVRRFWEELLPVSRETVKYMVSSLKGMGLPEWPEYSVDYAVIWLQLRYQTMFHYNQSGRRNEVPTPHIRMQDLRQGRPKLLQNRLAAAVARLRNVQVVNTDGLEMLEKLRGDSRNVIYCDPPYLGKDHYESKVDRDRMLDLLTSPGLKAAVGVSGYEGDWPELDGEWDRYQKTRKSGRHETLWVNRPYTLVS